MRVYAVMVAAFFDETVLWFPLFGTSFHWVFDFSFQGTGIPLVWPRTQVSAASFSTDLDDKGTHECFNDLSCKCFIYLKYK